MNMQKKCIASLIMAVSSASLMSCASNQDAALDSAAHRPIVVDSYSTPSAAELYAQRYQSTITQVTTGAQRRFVNCADDCLGVTLKTLVANLNAAVARRAQQTLRAGPRAGIASTTLSASDTVALDTSTRTLSGVAARPAEARVARVVASNASKVKAPGVETTVGIGPPAKDAKHSARIDQEHAEDIGEPK